MARHDQRRVRPTRVLLRACAKVVEDVSRWRVHVKQVRRVHASRLYLNNTCVGQMSQYWQVITFHAVAHRE